MESRLPHPVASPPSDTLLFTDKPMADVATGVPATVCPLGRKGGLTPLDERESRVTFARMRGRPFGYDSAGRPAAQVDGKMIKAALATLKDCVGRRAAASVPREAPEAERARAIEGAQSAAVEALVSRLNETILDPAYHVTAEKLGKDGHRYSREFELFVNVFCHELAGDPRYYWMRGASAIPPSLATIFRPFATRRIFDVVPRVTARFVDTDVRVLETSDTSAVLRWSGQRQQEGLPPELRTEWLEMSCPAFCGAYSSIPERVDPERGPARVKALRCQRQGSEACEWRFTWESPRPRPGLEVWGGIAASLLLLAGAALRIPWRGVLALFALVPALLGFHAFRRALLLYESERRGRALGELQPLAEELHTRVDSAQASVQIGELERVRRGDWLAAFERVSAALADGGSPETLLKTGLAPLSERGLFDRGFVLLLDREKRNLVGAASTGASPETAARLRKLVEPLAGSIFADVLAGAAPTLLGVDELRYSALVGFWVTLATRELAALPLLARGRALGVLVVDNTPSGRPISEEDRRLLVAIGGVLALGLDRASLKAELDDGETTHPGARVS